MIFSAPLFLLLLLALPVIIWLGWPARGPSRGREVFNLGVRLLLALLLIAGLAGLELKHAADRLAVVFLVDASDSMTWPVTIQNGTETLTATPRQLAEAYVRDALQRLGPDDEAAVILFGADALVERPMSGQPDTEAFTSKVIPLQTDLAGAIRLGLALLPADAARRMVIVSDGIDNSGDAYAVAQLARDSGTQILVVALPLGLGNAEALITQVSAPTNLHAGEQFGLEVTIESVIDQAVGVRVLSGAASVYEGRLILRRGVNAYSLPLEAGAAGFADYRVLLVPPTQGDTFHQNNELSAYALIAGPPKVLVIQNPEPRDGVDETQALVAALAATNWDIEVQPPAALPAEPAALASYAAVVLVDVPARMFSASQLTALQAYVRDLGGGLVAVGGPSAYGVGGYFRTPLEDMLPVEMQIKDQQRRARVTIVFVIDHSGSMSETSGGVPKVELAKEAVIRSIDLLSPQDKVGVVAFDDSATWVVNITSLEDAGAVKNAVGTIRADGGTDIFGGVKAVAQVLPNDDGAVRHIILLTDGGADPSGIPQLVAQLYNDYGITLSTVGVGKDAAAFLPQLAQVGGGLYHFAADPSTIPSIFAEETTLATRAYIIEGEFFPAQVSPSDMLQGIESVPALLGYVGTTAKDTAQTILISDQKDPVLAAWRYGLGKTVAWTSDATGRWAKQWVAWPQYARFWAQAVRYTLSESTPTNVTARVDFDEHAGAQAVITVDALAQSGTYLNGLILQVNVIDPEGQTQTVTLRQIAPGRYSGAFAPTAQGVYVMRISGADPNQPAQAVAQTAGWVLSYSPEYRVLTAQPNFLAQVAAITGGAQVKQVDEIFAHNLPAPARATQPLWPWLLLAAALLLPLDIAGRRLVLTRYDWLRAAQRARDWAAGRTVTRTPERVEQMSALFKAKNRAGSAKLQPPAAPPANRPPPPARREPPAAPEPPPAIAPTSTAPPAHSGTTSALLRAKKRAKDKL